MQLDRSGWLLISVQCAGIFDDDNWPLKPLDTAIFCYVIIANLFTARLGSLLDVNQTEHG